jgi:hypothetical protein
MVADQGQPWLATTSCATTAVEAPVCRARITRTTVPLPSETASATVAAQAGSGARHGPAGSPWRRQPVAIGRLVVGHEADQRPSDFGGDPLRQAGRR